jgi:hypothetical protein
LGALNPQAIESDMIKISLPAFVVLEQTGENNDALSGWRQRMSGLVYGSQSPQFHSNNTVIISASQLKTAKEAFKKGLRSALEETESLPRGSGERVGVVVADWEVF